MGGASHLVVLDHDASGIKRQRGPGEVELCVGLARRCVRHGVLCGLAPTGGKEVRERSNLVVPGPPVLSDHSTAHRLPLSLSSLAGGFAWPSNLKNVLRCAGARSG